MPTTTLFLAAAVFIALSPCVVLLTIAVFRSLSPARTDPDSRIIAKLRQIEADRQDLILRWEENQLQVVQMVERVRFLERLLIDERRQRLAETEEILNLRETCAQLRAKLEKAAHAIRTTHSALSRRAAEKLPRA